MNSTKTRKPTLRKIAIAIGAVCAVSLTALPMASAAPLDPGFHIKALNEPDPAFWGIYPKLSPGSGEGSGETPGGETPGGEAPGGETPGEGGGTGEIPGGGEVPGGGDTGGGTGPVTPEPEDESHKPFPENANGDMVFTINMSAPNCKPATALITLEGIKPNSELRGPDGVQKLDYIDGTTSRPVNKSGTWALKGGFKRISFVENACVTAVTSWTNTGTSSLRAAFFKAYNVTSVVAPPSGVKDMSDMFFEASSFRGDGVGSWDTSKVTNMNRMFHKATVFDADLSGWDTSSVTDMGSLFFEATNFKGTGLNEWKTGNVTSMQWMFYKATSFTNDLSEWDVCKVTARGNFNLGATLYSNKPALQPKWGTCS